MKNITIWLSIFPLQDMWVLLFWGHWEKNIYWVYEQWPSLNFLILIWKNFIWTVFFQVFSMNSVLLLFYVWGFWPRGMSNHSSLTRDWTRRWTLNHWANRAVPKLSNFEMETQDKLWNGYRVACILPSLSKDNLITMLQYQYQDLQIDTILC